VVGSDGNVYHNAVCVPPGVAVVGVPTGQMQGLGDTSFLSTPVASLFGVPLGWVLLFGVGMASVLYTVLKK
jgi:hypothetical protein